MEYITTPMLECDDTLIVRRGLPLVATYGNQFWRCCMLTVESEDYVKPTVEFHPCTEYEIDRIWDIITINQRLAEFISSEEEAEVQEQCIDVTENKTLKSRRKPGPKGPHKNMDVNQDQEICRGWKCGGYKTITEYSQKVWPKLTEKQVRLAMERERKRNLRGEK
jgi:hypothetical protein